MTMRWLSLLFLHWPVEVDQLRRLIPEALEMDVFDAWAWVGLVPFTMRDVRRCGGMGVPSATHFHECNVRTYVTYRGEPGVWFFSLDASSRLAVWGARRFWNLPYFHSRINLQRDSDETIRYSVDRLDEPRAAMQCAWRPDEPRERSGPGTAAHFLTERYCLYSVSRRGEIMRCRIQHEPWPLRDAKVLELDDSLIRASGIDVDLDLARNPLLAWHADELLVRVWPLRRADL